MQNELLGVSGIAIGAVFTGFGLYLVTEEPGIVLIAHGLAILTIGVYFALPHYDENAWVDETLEEARITEAPDDE